MGLTELCWVETQSPGPAREAAGGTERKSALNPLRTEGNTLCPFHSRIFQKCLGGGMSSARRGLLASPMPW